MRPQEVATPPDASGAAAAARPPAASGEERAAARALRAAEAARNARPDSRLEWLLDGRGWPLLRPVVDAVGLLLAVFVVLRWPGGRLPAPTDFIIYPPVVMVLLGLRGMYARRLRVSILDGVAPLLSSVSLAVMLLAVVLVYVMGDDPGSAVLAHLWVVSLFLLSVGRVGCAAAQRLARASLRVGRPVLIVGAGDVGARVARRLQGHPDYGLRPIGFLDVHPPHDALVAGLPVLGGHDDVDWIASITGARHVVLAFTQYGDAELVGFAQRCADLGLEVSIVPRLFESVNARASYEALGGLPLLALRPTSPHGWRFATKHFLDRAVALAILLLLAPVLVVIALATKLTSAGPVLFRQRRVGRDGEAFDLLKFRSMHVSPEGGDFAPRSGSAPGGVEGTDRRTAVGRLLRRTSLDELPQLLNVLRGDMSLVGPRPERPEYVETFSRDLPRYAERHRVRSGITGWAQVHGLRGQTSLTDRVEWDNYYIEHWTPALDLKILVLTCAAIFRRAE